MLYAVYAKEYTEDFGGFDRMRFSNVVFVSYSAFDIPIFDTNVSEIVRSIPTYSLYSVR